MNDRPAGPLEETSARPDRPVRLEPWQDPRAVPYVRLDKVTKSYGGTVAVDEVSLSIYQGELFALLGASGCGKTTLLRMLAGFEQPTSGKIYIDGVDMTGVPPYERPVNIMFQAYALFPHMTVEQNVAFGLHQERRPRREIRERVGDMLRLVQLERLGKRKPHQLSGGQRQRVALARCLVKQPKLLLLDEPLAALDKKLREQTQFELVNIQERVGITFIMVTHDQEEAMAMSGRIAVMDTGWIRQIGTPTEIYEFPQSRFVAEFIGSVNLFDGLVVEERPDHVVIESRELGGALLVGHTVSVPAGTPVSVAVRPEKITIGTDIPEPAANSARGEVEEIAYLGDVSVYLVRLVTGKQVRVTAPNTRRRSAMPITWNEPVTLRWHADAGIVLSQ